MRSRAWPPPRPAGPRPDRLSQPLPAGQRCPPGRHQGRAALHARRSWREHVEGLVALSDAATVRSRGGSWPAIVPGADAVARRSGRALGPGERPRSGFFLELQHHLLPDDDFLVVETARPGPSGSGCRSWSPTTATTRGRRIASCRRAGRHPPRPDARRERPPASVERGVPPQVGRRAGWLPPAEPGGRRRIGRTGSVGTRLGGGAAHGR